jgi:hypothetical protein
MPVPPRATGDNPYGPQVTFRTEDVLPPTAFYLSMDDTLLAQFLTNDLGLTFTLTVRMLLADGTLMVDNYQTTPSPFNGTIYYAIVPPVEGYVLSCMVQSNTNAESSCWCNVIAFRGTITLPAVVFPPVAGIVIVQGYVDEFSYLSWPQSPLTEAGVGAGHMRNIMLTPAAGSNWKLQSSMPLRWEVIALQCTLTTSAAVANRQMSVVVFDRLNNPIVRIPTNFTQAAGLAYSYYFYNGATHLQTNTTWITAPFPQGVFLDNGMYLQSRVVNLDAGDVWSLVNVLVREWMGVGHS